jgi:hypothetical protein
METYLPCLGVSSVEEVTMLELDIGRQKTFPNLWLISHRRNQSWGCTTLNFGRGNYNQYPEKSGDQGDGQYRERKTDNKQLPWSTRCLFLWRASPPLCVPAMAGDLPPSGEPRATDAGPAAAALEFLPGTTSVPPMEREPGGLGFPLPFASFGGFGVKTSRKLRHDVSYNKNKNK